MMPGYMVQKHSDTGMWPLTCTSRFTPYLLKKNSHTKGVSWVAGAEASESILSFSM